MPAVPKARRPANAPMRRPRLTAAPRSWPAPPPVIATTSFTRNHFGSAPWRRAAGSRARRSRPRCSMRPRPAAWSPTMARRRRGARSNPGSTTAPVRRIRICRTRTRCRPRRKRQSRESPPRCSLADAHAVFKKWLGDEYDLDAASAAIAAAASERLPGDPLWLLIVAGPGGAKTETVQALAGAGAHVTSTIASEGALAVRDTAPGAQQEGHRRTTAQDRRPRRPGDQRRYQHPDRPTATRAPACLPPFGKSMTADGSATSAPTAARP